MFAVSLQNLIKDRKHEFEPVVFGIARLSYIFTGISQQLPFFITFPA
jgi:hypothetical protein